MAPVTPSLHSIPHLPKSATHRQVTKAFKKAALANRPDHGGSTEPMAATGGTSNVESDQNGESDGDHVEGDDDNVLSDGDSGSGSDTGASVDSSDGDECAFAYDYGDLEETGGSYMVAVEDGLEITLEKHEEVCGCDLDAEDAIHFIASRHDDDGDDDDADNGLGDMEETSHDNKVEDFDDKEVDDIDDGFVDEGFEDGGGED